VKTFLVGYKSGQSYHQNNIQYPANNASWTEHLHMYSLPNQEDSKETGEYYKTVVYDSKELTAFHNQRDISRHED